MIKTWSEGVYALSLLCLERDCYEKDDGNRSFWGGNYDAETGKERYLPDVVTDIDDFAKVVEAELFSTVGADIFLQRYDY